MKKSQKWPKSFFWTIVENQWSNNVRGVTSSHKSVKLVLYECFRLCSNKKYFSDLFQPKSPFLGQYWLKSAKIVNIQHFGESGKVGLGKVGAHFFHQLLMIARVSKSYLKTRLIGSTFLPRQTYIRTYLLQRTTKTITSSCGPWRDNR